MSAKANEDFSMIGHIVDTCAWDKTREKRYLASVYDVEAANCIISAVKEPGKLIKLSSQKHRGPGQSGLFSPRWYLGWSMRCIVLEILRMRQLQL